MMETVEARGQVSPGNSGRGLRRRSEKSVDSPRGAPSKDSRNAGPLGVGSLLGIEGGGTRTVALTWDPQTGASLRAEGGPSNVRLMTDQELGRRLTEMTRCWPSPAAVGIGLAGARTEADCERIRRVAGMVWPGVPCLATNDLDTAWAAAGRLMPKLPVRVVVISGTGSCCMGRAVDGRTARVGGWGHWLGDRGSGYGLAQLTLRELIKGLDRDQSWGVLGAGVLRFLQLTQVEDLVAWVQGASKDKIASVASEVFRASAAGDELAQRCVAQAAQELVADAAACGARLLKRGRPLEFVLAGGMFRHQASYTEAVTDGLRRAWPRAVVRILDRESVWGAVALASGLAARGVSRDWESGSAMPDAEEAENLAGSAEGLDRAVIRSSPTEQRNPRSMELDRLPLKDAVSLMLREEAQVVPALRACADELVRVVEWVARALRRGGRLIYVGAGTSGRLGVLDASECPPTFRTPPEWVQGIMAGGYEALWRSVEGAEDHAEEGESAIRGREVTRKDVVVGIAASGRTPFVLGALAEARRRGARTVLLCFNPGVVLPPPSRPHLVIAPRVGPEVLTGSTRLKCGTATKLVLNLITTLAMVRCGKVRSNLMIDLNPSNAKLRDRAVRIVLSLTGLGEAEARAALERSDWSIQKALRLRRCRRRLPD